MISKRVQVATAWEPGLGTGLDLHMACSGRGCMDILAPDRDAGPVLLTHLPHFYCRFARIPGPNFLLQKSEIRFLAEMSHPCASVTLTVFGPPE
jgi:hypothetical protein